MEVFPFILRDVIFTCFEVFCSEMYIFWMDLFTFFCYWIYSKWNQNLTLPIARDTTFYIFTDLGNDSNLLIVFYVQIMPDDFVMQLHRF